MTETDRAFATIRLNPGSGRHRGWRVSVYDPAAPEPLHEVRNERIEPDADAAALAPRLLGWLPAGYAARPEDVSDDGDGGYLIDPVARG